MEKPTLTPRLGLFCAQHLARVFDLFRETRPARPDDLRDSPLPLHSPQPATSLGPPRHLPLHLVHAVDAVGWIAAANGRVGEGLAGTQPLALAR